MPGFLDSTTQVNVTVGGQTFQVWDEAVPGQVREVFAKDPSQARAELRLLLPWAQRQQLAIALLGNTVTIAGTPNYQLAAAYPDFPLYKCKLVEISGDGLTSVGPNGLLAWERARCRCFFAAPAYDPGSPVALGNISMDFTRNVIAMDQSKPGFQFDASNLIPPSQAPALSFTTVMFTIDRYEQPFIPFAQILATAGGVNNGTSAVIGGAAAETLLFHGAKTSRNTTPAGGLNWVVSYVCEWNGSSMGGTTASWNRLWKPGSGWTAFTKTDGTKLFTPVDLSFITT